VGRRDRSEFSEFALARAGALQRAAYLMVGDSQLAQDLVQEALTKTYVAWPRLRDPRNAEAYCRKAITTTAISWFRRKGWNNERPTEHLPDDVSSGNAGHEATLAERDAVWRAMRQLPPRQRAALVLRFYDDLSEAQTAEAMGCAVGTVKSQVAAGLAKLRDQLGDGVELLTDNEWADERADQGARTR
jgi:RNA polymerase sigma-70 factor (sigma-E family)